MATKPPLPPEVTLAEIEAQIAAGVAVTLDAYARASAGRGLDALTAKVAADRKEQQVQTDFFQCDQLYRAAVQKNRQEIPEVVAKLRPPIQKAVDALFEAIASKNSVLAEIQQRRDRAAKAAGYASSTNTVSPPLNATEHVKDIVSAIHDHVGFVAYEMKP